MIRMTAHTSMLRAFALAMLATLLVLPTASFAQSVLSEYLDQVEPGELVAGADAFGPIGDGAPVAPLYSGGRTVGHVFITSDFVGTTGYSGKPIHTMVALDDAARIVGLRLVKHSEPIVLIGIPEREIRAMIDGYVGLDLVAEAA